jgi:hypothetical protein
VAEPVFGSAVTGVAGSCSRGTAGGSTCSTVALGAEVRPRVVAAAGRARVRVVVALAALVAPAALVVLRRPGFVALLASAVVVPLRRLEAAV